MPASFVDILERLERLAAYDGPWRPMREEAARLRERLAELRRRETRLDDLLVIALVGGSGVGKSTVLNAIAGDQLAEVSEFRPCTSQPTVYAPPGAEFEVADWRVVSGSALENLIIIDTPDSDTVVREHRASVEEALTHSDLIIICGSPEKYLDEATWSLLRPVRRERTLVCLETKAHTSSDSIREHWLERLRVQGFEIDEYFRVNALRSLDRKLAGGDPMDDEYQWPEFERFLEESLTQERIRRIKRSNAIGLLRKTLDGLYQRVGERTADLESLEEALRIHESALSAEACDAIQQRLFTEPHLWTFAQGREVGRRASGVVGSLFRAVEGLRELPGKLAALLPLRRHTAGRQAAGLLTGGELVAENFEMASQRIDAFYEARHGELTLAMAQAGFDTQEAHEGTELFRDALRQRVTDVLRGPARERIVARARKITSLPARLTVDALPLAFFIVTGWQVVATYARGEIMGPGFFVHALAVFAIIILAEALAVSVTVRASAWGVRRGAMRDLRAACLAPGAAFQPERRALDEALAIADETERLHRQTQDDPPA